MNRQNEIKRLGILKGLTEGAVYFIDLKEIPETESTGFDSLSFTMQIKARSGKMYSMKYESVTKWDVEKMQGWILEAANSILYDIERK